MSNFGASRKLLKPWQLTKQKIGESSPLANAVQKTIGGTVLLLMGSHFIVDVLPNDHQGAPYL
jgi:hypothetical protein